MYLLVLTLHSWLRWAALAAGVAATLAVALDRSGDREGSTGRWGLLLMMTVDLQLVLGLLLYFVVSPNMQVVREHFAEAMGTASTRFWAVEHPSAMLLAVVLVHLGRVFARRAATPAARRTRQLVCFALGTVLMIAATPWPGLASGRPLFRL